MYSLLVGGAISHCLLDVVFFGLYRVHIVIFLEHAGFITTKFHDEVIPGAWFQRFFIPSVKFIIVIGACCTADGEPAMSVHQAEVQDVIEDIIFYICSFVHDGSIEVSTAEFFSGACASEPNDGTIEQYESFFLGAPFFDISLCLSLAHTEDISLCLFCEWGQEQVLRVGHIAVVCSFNSFSDEGVGLAAPPLRDDISSGPVGCVDFIPAVSRGVAKWFREGNHIYDNKANVGWCQAGGQLQGATEVQKVDKKFYGGDQAGLSSQSHLDRKDMTVCATK